MFSSDPTALLRKESLDKDEMIRALRGALMAELDAINYYLQQGKLFSDEKLKKVHDDIAREEITHFGEFLRLLYPLNKEEFNYIVKGWNEASKLIGDQETFPIPLEVKERSEPKSEGGNPGRNGEVSDQVMRYLNEGLSSRRIREIGNVVNYPKNSVTVYDLIEEKEGITQGENSTLYPLPRLTETVKVRFDADPVSASNALVSAGARYARKEDSLLLTEHPLSRLSLHFHFNHFMFIHDRVQGLSPQPPT